ncbi:hypothetical protein B5C34_12330 [Pacificimonas flava]|uniref:Hda lid domain-containing protein n=2 Tax=Pacificimonas TaxID=1960290 RepID=A0A219B727_9SPHN|nr:MULTISPECIES: chromosomal replication initiator DnaA [Pacificimonas]MBZ6378547.1 chromosomal replication initiator DnaA [Pacificimonas aurantium]OWV34167.1 hypothetical protein B5C34_12330 [Pacificimonas flava]
MSGQLGLPLAFQGQEVGDFIVTPANEDAAKGVSGWADWPDGAALLVAPAKSGALRLARSVERESAGAVTLWPDADSAAGEGAPETQLFHALNRAREGETVLLLLAESMPGCWPVGLPDLRSRLLALPIFEIGAPDDELVAELLHLKFTERGLAVAPDVIEYLQQRAERDYLMLDRLAEEIDRAALEQGRRVTVPLVSPILNRNHEGEE